MEANSGRSESFMENNPANHVLAAASQSSILRDLTKAEKIC